MKNWDSYERAANRGPIQIGFISIITISILVAIIWGIGTVFGLFAETASVAQQEFGATAMVHKYEWFKDAASQLDRKKADLTMFDARINSLKKSGTPDSVAQAEAERIGVASSYNDLAARYNSAMAKINWRFANVGNVPAGSEPLPREYREYVGAP